MKMQIQEREISTGGVTETNEFTIAANGKAFSVLIDGLYSNKIRSVIRELWSNAYDAHRMAANADTPFTCKLPSQFDPEFAVRDYGISMSHEEIMGLYTTVFQSSKEDTNNQVGKLGLGSKSPFAYTDTFTVTACQHGAKRSYSAFIGETGIPTIALMSEEQSDEQRGVTVSFPVKTTDIREFETEAKEVAKGFDVKPDITNSTLEFAAPATVVEGTGWKMLNEDRYSARAVARQGCVIYPIDVDAIKGATDKQRDLLRSALYIDFPIGELEISASRESLGYDDDTCANILKRLDIVSSEIRGEFDAKLAACSCLWDARVMRNELSNNSSLPYNVSSGILSALKYRGKTVNGSLNLDAERLVKANIQNVGVDYHSSSDLNRRKTLRWDTNKKMYFNPNKTTMVYVQDPAVKTVRGTQRLKQDLAVYGRNTSLLWIKADPKSYAFKRLLVKLGRPNWADVADLDDIPQEIRTTASGTRKKVNLKEITLRETRDLRDYDIEEGGVYVDMNRDDFIRPDGSTSSHHTVRQIRSVLVELNILDEDTKIIGIPASKKTLPKGKSEWVSLFTLAAATLKLNYDATKSAKAAHYKDEAHSGGTWTDIARDDKSSLTTTPATPWQVYVATVWAIDELVATTTEDLKHARLAELMGSVGVNQDFETFDLTGKMGCLEAVYPMAELVFESSSSWSVNQETKDKVLDYIKLIDNSGQNA